MDKSIILNSKDCWRKETNLILAKICKGINNYRSPKEEVYRTLEARAGCCLNVRLQNLKAKAKTQGFSTSAIKKMNYLDVIANDNRLRDTYIEIVKDMSVKHKIKI